MTYRILSALLLLLACRAFGSSATANLGQTVTLKVMADGSEPLAYQWNKDGADIAGANSASLVILSARASDAGVYSVAVSNPAGSTLSDNAAISVLNMVTLKITAMSSGYPDAVLVSWQRNGATIPGANDWTYTFDPAAQPGNISARVTWPNPPAPVTPLATTASK